MSKYKTPTEYYYQNKYEDLLVKYYRFKEVDESNRQLLRLYQKHFSDIIKSGKPAPRKIECNTK